MSDLLWSFQLSSKCENRLFRIRFDIPRFERCPFLEALSRPIRCISRSRNTRIPTMMWKKPTSTIHLINGCQSSMLDDGCFDLQQHTVREAKHSPSSKRVRLGQENVPTVFMSDYSVGKRDLECNSYAWNTNQVCGEGFCVWVDAYVRHLTCLAIFDPHV